MHTVNDQELEKIPLGRILCIDFGTKRIGLAKSDPSQMLASSHSTISNFGTNIVLESLHNIIEEESVITMVVGMPYNMDGSKSDRTKQVELFVEKLKNEFPIPILEWDERWSSISAEKVMIETGRSPSKNRHKVDQVAAAIILQSFLERLDRFKKSCNQVI
jgi:putative holliday junction resolvase